ncbi:unnamed protein product [Symbiodinium sp. CCMP2592]|nr:unnamed protein product [Symbiodinium sp. CCMP2592]
MARSRSPAVRRLLTRGTAGIDDIFLSPLTTEERRRCRCLEAEGKDRSDDEDSVEEPSSSSVDDMEEHTSHSLEHLGTSASQDAIQDYSQGDVSSSGSVQSAGVPLDILEQLNEEAAQLEDLRRCSVPCPHVKQARFKWGGCPHHERRSLQPHLVQSGANRGQLVLRCAAFWRRGGDHHEKCFYAYPFPWGLFHKLPDDLKSSYGCVDFALSRGINYTFGYTLAYKQMSGGQGPDCQGIVRAMYLFSMRVPVDAAPLLADRDHKYLERTFQRFRRAAAFQMMAFQLDMRFPPGVVEFDGMRSSGRKNRAEGESHHLGRFLVACHRSSANTVFLPLPDKRTKVGAPGLTSLLHFPFAAMALEVSADFSLALGAAVLTALDLHMPDKNVRDAWRCSHLLRMLRVTMACYDIRRNLGPHQSKAELEVLTLAAHVLACVFATEDRLITLGDCPLAPVVPAPDHQTFRDQVRVWGGGAWRNQLDHLHQELRMVLLELSQCSAIFQHSRGLRQLFSSWQGVLEDFNLLVAGLLQEPTTVRDQLCPPESTAEVLPWVQKKLCPYKHVVGSDQSKGLAKAWRTLNVQAATACHGKAHYTPVVKLKTSLIPRQALKNLKACSRANVNRSTVTMVGGDQRCESQVASLKRMLRRCNMLGRSSSKSSRCHIDGLSSRFLQEHQGFEKIAAAVAAYQNFYQDSVSPKDLWEQTSFLDAQAP